MARQQAILVEQQPEVHLVVGQAALHQQVGRPEVMTAQLRRLAEPGSDGGNVTMQILPFEAGPNPAAAEGSLSILQLTGTAGLGLVHLGGITRAVCLEGRADLVAYTKRNRVRSTEGTRTLLSSVRAAPARARRG